jgi:hypothetical protein
MNGTQAYDAVQNGLDGVPQIGWRGAWPEDKAIANDDGVVDVWVATAPRPQLYTLSKGDAAATDWVLAQDNGDRPPRT